MATNHKLLEINMGKQKFKEMLELSRAADCKLQEAIKVVKKARKCFGVSDSEEFWAEGYDSLINQLESFRGNLITE